MPTPLPIVDRPIRIGVVGLGQIAELVLPPYLAHPEIEVVAVCDRDPSRLDRWRATLPADCLVTSDLDELLAGEADVVDVLVPTPLHADVATRVLEAGFHLQLQKPIARSQEESERSVAAARAAGAFLRILEDYTFYPPLVRRRALR